MIDPRKLDAVKTWYAIFTTVIDAKDIPDDAKLAKLKKLREAIKKEAPELETN